LGFHIQWRGKQGTNRWYVYAFVAKRPIRSLKAKIPALTRRTPEQDFGCVLTRLNQVMHARISEIPVTRYRWRGMNIPTCSPQPPTHNDRDHGESAFAGGSATGLEKRTSGDADTALQADSTASQGPVLWTQQEYARPPVGTGTNSGRWGTWWAKVGFSEIG
jgi:hypothetical protein